MAGSWLGAARPRDEGIHELAHGLRKERLEDDG
jgi:hypothetical protein